jgi:hypothetical protein
VNSGNDLIVFGRELPLLWMLSKIALRRAFKWYVEHIMPWAKALTLVSFISMKVLQCCIVSGKETCIDRREIANLFYNSITECFLAHFD